MSGLKKNPTFYFGLLFVAVFAFGAIVWQSSRAQTSDKYEEEFHQTIKDALAEIKLPTTNNVAEINAVAENLADFIEYRSGVRLSQANKDLLRELEGKSWNQSKKINQGNLTRILADAAIDRIENAADADLEYAAKTLGGFDAPDLPNNKRYGKHLILRASGAGYIEKDDFVEQSKVLRDTIKTNKIAQSFVIGAISREVEQRIDLLVKASPKEFGDSRSGLTPAQAILIAYSVTADDVPARNKKDLQITMEAIQKAFSRNGENYPIPNGHHAYGDNGYIFSTPASLLLDDATLGKILNGIREKGGLR